MIARMNWKRLFLGILVCIFLGGLSFAFYPIFFYVAPAQLPANQLLKSDLPAPVPRLWNLKNGQAEPIIDLRKKSKKEGRFHLLHFLMEECEICQQELDIWKKNKAAFQELKILTTAIVVGSTESLDDLFPLASIFDAVFLDQEGAVWQDWLIRGVPQTYFLNPEGHVIYKIEGKLDPHRVGQVLQSYSKGEHP